MSLPQQRESLPAWPWGLHCPTFIRPLYSFYTLLPDRREFEINKKMEDIYVSEEQEEHGKRWCRGATLLIINRTNCWNQSRLSLPEQGNTCMIIVNDGPNCPFNASGAVTDTAWLKLANTGLLSISLLQGGTGCLKFDGGYKRETNGR